MPTNRRAVIVAGPAASVRGDQLGLLRREVRWTEPVELFVHPVTARLQPSAAGLVRDLEGEVTKTITDNDISFHALRAYEPGDALRNVHWRTSARTGQLMVRQYEETRRSQLVLAAVDRARRTTRPTTSSSSACRCSPRIGVQVIRDATRVARGHRGAAPAHRDADRAARRHRAASNRRAGVRPPLRDFVREARSVPRAERRDRRGRLARCRSPISAPSRRCSGSDTQMIAFRAELGAASRIARIAGSTVVTVGSLDELPRLVRRVRP